MFGRFYASCLQVKADRGDFFVDLEVGEGRGKELPTPQRLLCWVAWRHGKRFVGVLLADGLYITPRFLTRCRRLGRHVLVKTSEEGSLNVLEDAGSIFDSPEMADAVERVRGVDADRNAACEAELDQAHLWETWRLRKVTLRFLVATWMADVGLVEPLCLTG